MVTRGFASLSYIHNAAETIERVGKPTYIYYFGDYDPSGVEIDRNLERGCVERHVDPARLAVLEAAEASERELLGGLPAIVRERIAASAIPTPRVGLVG